MDPAAGKVQLHRSGAGRHAAARALSALMSGGEGSQLSWELAESSGQARSAGLTASTTPTGALAVVAVAVVLSAVLLAAALAVGAMCGKLQDGAADVERPAVPKPQPSRPADPPTPKPVLPSQPAGSMQSSLS